jgi:hypothetical protein
MSDGNLTPSQLITNRIESLNDWRGEMLARFRQLINEASPELKEDWKWESAVFTHNGNVVACGIMKEHVKLNFFKGAQLDDPAGLFNAGLEAKKRGGLISMKAMRWIRPPSQNSSRPQLP